ncbi:division/cell wall cluster transcriptional repressor MraZ [Halopseudomonas phragmitis]|uniref:Transcriptional regulator MraZ n=2 Tax=Pseudomonadaceae TaxID=135621 RepID=A0A1V0B486_9GAMM|nr:MULTISPECIES: division/cell wall cluster transcriptional repressor MraZ [Pseudomonadaceae]AQZ94743.1 cell division/cell wall cluster transcriptional repressor MraZ [Halopseudomonas phragmitis]PAU88482.1 transcriptional regulator MraZ [Pseudomonas sp. WN033]RHW22900.1 transcriptional regulator MraZ [Pseudomonas jilinensis]
MFRGANAINLDAKGRLAMPARYRDRLVELCAGQLVATIALEERCLWIYPLPEWEAVEMQLKKAPNLNPAVKRLNRLLIGNANEIELDSNGRFVVPPLLRDHAGLDKKVMLVGQLNKFELWSEEAWEATTSAYLEEVQEVGELPAELHSLSL